MNTKITIDSFLPSSPEGSIIESGVFGGDHRVKGRALNLIEKMRDHNEALRTADVHIHYTGDYGAVITVVGVPCDFKGWKGLDRKVGSMNGRYEKIDRKNDDQLCWLFNTGDHNLHDQCGDGLLRYEVAYC